MISACQKVTVGVQKTVCTQTVPKTVTVGGCILLRLGNPAQTFHGQPVSTCTCHISGHTWLLHGTQLSVIIAIFCQAPCPTPSPNLACTRAHTHTHVHRTLPDGAGPVGAQPAQELEVSRPSPVDGHKEPFRWELEGPVACDLSRTTKGRWQGFGEGGWSVVVTACIIERLLRAWPRTGDL